MAGRPKRPRRRPITPQGRAGDGTRAWRPSAGWTTLILRQRHAEAWNDTTRAKPLTVLGQAEAAQAVSDAEEQTRAYVALYRLAYPHGSRGVVRTRHEDSQGETA